MNAFARGWQTLGVTLLLGALALILAPASAQSVRVSEIEIRGNQKINRESILTVISTKVGDELAPERVERDKLAIENLGWFLLVNQSFLRQGNMAKVVFVVTEYPVVTQLDIRGSTLFKPDALRAAFKTKVGQIFNRVDWEADLAALDKMYTDKGYQARFTVNLDQTEFLQNGVLRIEANELKVGSVKIKWPQREIKDKKGNVIRTVDSHKTKEYVVRRELTLTPGALFNQQQLTRDYRTLTNLGFFETINPNVEVAADLSLTITWELVEKRTGQVSVGAGYSPRQQLIGRGELSDQNFRGKGQGVSFSAEIGTFGGDGAPSAELQFYEPWLTKDHTSMTVAVYNKLIYRFSRQLQNINNNNDRYFERRVGGQLNFGRPFRLPIALGLRFENVRTDELPQGIAFPRQDGTVIAGNIARVFNTRDYVNNPTQGHFVRLTTELGTASLNNVAPGGVDPGFFGKYLVDARRYIALRRIKATRDPEREQEAQKTPIIAVRLLAGTVSGEVPFFEQFFLGGAETLRGYLEDRFWGKTMFLGSIEYRRPILNRITGVLFADVGDAFGSDSSFRLFGRPFGTDFRQHGGITLNGSVGFGLRVVTPIGPIRLDFGYGREGGRTHFNVGNTF